MQIESYRILHSSRPRFCLKGKAETETLPENTQDVKLCQLVWYGSSERPRFTFVELPFVTNFAFPSQRVRPATKCKLNYWNFTMSYLRSLSLDTKILML